MQLAVDAGFAVHGKPATYTPPGGSAAPCTIVKDAQDQTITFGNSRPFDEGDLLEIRASEISTPVRNGVIALQDGSNETFTIIADPQMHDPERLIWTCRCASS